LSYLNRSGSTYLINQLSKSQNICVCPESEILYDLFLKNPEDISCSKDLDIRARTSMLYHDKKFKFWKLSYEKIMRIIKVEKKNIRIFTSILMTYSELTNPKANIIIFKHTWSLNLLATYSESVIKEFDLKWILLIRDIRAIYESQRRIISPLSQKVMCSNWFSLVLDWNYFLKISNLYSNCTFVKVVKYEDFIMKPESIINSICNFLNIVFNSEWIINKKGVVYNLLDEEYQKIHQEINLPPNKLNIYKWNLSLEKKEKDLISIFSSRYLLNTFNQKLENSKIFTISYIFEIIQKILRHLIFVLKRNIYLTIKSC
jgi:hypothetical protein